MTDSTRIEWADAARKRAEAAYVALTRLRVSTQVNYEFEEAFGLFIALKADFIAALDALQTP